MSNLVEIKKRIESITSTIKVTKVMQMIATAKIAKIKTKMSAVEKYNNYANEIVSEYLKNIEDTAEFDKYFIKNENNKNILFVVFSSDKGTCGSINTNIFKEINILIKQHQDKRETITILPIGKKAVKYFETNASKIGVNVYQIDKYADAEYCNNEIIHNTVNNLIVAYNNGRFGEIHFVYHKFKNIITCNAVDDILLPFDKSQINIEKAEFFNITKTEFISSSIIEFFIRTKLYNAYISNIASIVSSRMNAMDNATKNGQEIIDELKIKYNKGRQANITSELSDIVSGFEAIS